MEDASVTFEPDGPLSHTITVQLLVDQLNELTERYAVEIAGVSGPAEINESADTFEGDIVEGTGGGSPTLYLNIFPAIVETTEGSTIQLIAQRNQDLAEPLILTFDQITGTAQYGGQDADYEATDGTPGLLRITIPSGGTYGTTSVSILADQLTEGEEDFVLELITQLPNYVVLNDRVEVSILDVHPNALPNFTSEQIVDAYVGSTYQYTSTAFDSDNDSLSFHQGSVIYPDGFEPKPGEQIFFEYVNNGVPDQYGVYTWSPPAALANQEVTVHEIVWDGIGEPQSRPIKIPCSSGAVQLSTGCRK